MDTSPFRRVRVCNASFPFFMGLSAFSGCHDCCLHPAEALSACRVANATARVITICTPISAGNGGRTCHRSFPLVDTSNLSARFWPAPTDAHGRWINAKEPVSAVTVQFTDRRDSSDPLNGVAEPLRRPAQNFSDWLIGLCDYE